MRLIDADALEKAIVEMIIPNSDGNIENDAVIYNECCIDVLNKLDNQSTVEERPKGKWLYHRASNGLVVVKCSECKKTYGFLKTNFCPKCGADMRKETNKGETK